MNEEQKEVRQKAEALLGGKLLDLERLSGGGNNRLWKGINAEGKAVVLKFYFVNPADKRNRLETEFGALNFLWSNGVRNIPQPLLFDKSTELGIYSFVEGMPLSNITVNANDIDCAISFVDKLHRLSAAPGAAEQPAGSEACFSLNEVLQLVERRIALLKSLPRHSGPLTPELHKFLEEKLIPATGRLAGELKGIGIRSKDHSLAPQYRTLSPSDIGFHNGKRQSDGSWVFLDLEYFGWDDPTRLISDFIIHPGVSLNSDLAKRFVDGVLPIFSRDQEIHERLKFAIPLWGVKWCCTVLSAFDPKIRERRGFASAKALDVEGHLTEQLSKAHNIFGRFCLV